MCREMFCLSKLRVPLRKAGPNYEYREIRVNTGVARTATLSLCLSHGTCVMPENSPVYVCRIRGPKYVRCCAFSKTAAGMAKSFLFKRTGSVLFVAKGAQPSDGCFKGGVMYFCVSSDQSGGEGEPNLIVCESKGQVSEG